MLRLWLLRHAKSAWDDPELDDFARPLSPRGRKACRHIGRHMGERGIAPDLVLCSPATRTRQTWERIEKRIGGKAKVRFESSLYLAEVPSLLALVRAAPKACHELMLIGHNPGLEELALQLAGTSAGDSASRLADKYPTGALAELAFAVPNWSQVGPEAGFLASFVIPAQLDN